MIDARIGAEPLDPEAEFAAFLRCLGGAGAVVSFVGLARPVAGSGARVERLFLDHHPRLTLRSVRNIAEAARERFGAGGVRIVHRHGTIRAGEAIVFVAAASTHRRAAFEAADFAMDRLKTEAMFWKREDAADGVRWVEPVAGDYADAARWGP
ncbi:MAG: molybdenum cofactor biosynthesis protein MoaE [Cypionkella sp.]